jgi:hypothetical protein
VEIKARRIQFLNKRGFKNEAEDDYLSEDDVVVDTDSVSNNGSEPGNGTSVDYTEDSFDKFLSSEESDLIKD